MFVLPTRPDECKFLTPTDRIIALERINREHKESENERTTVHHVRRAIFNINNMICALGFFFINVSVQSFSLFLPTILNALGWTALKTQFYSVPPYVVASCWGIFMAWVSDYYQRRGYFIVMCTALSAVGYTVLVTATREEVKYFAVFLAACGAFPMGPAFLAWGLNNAAGPSVRAVTGGFIVAVGNCGAIVATWTYLPKDKPLYHTGHYINIGSEVCAMLVGVAGIAYTKWENGQREKGRRDHRLQGLTEEQANTLGYRHPEFRYMS